MKVTINVVSYILLGLLVISLYMNYLAGYWLNVFNITTAIIALTTVKNVLIKHLTK